MIKTQNKMSNEEIIIFVNRSPANEEVDENEKKT